MKATIDVPDGLYRRVKAKSAMEGRSIRSVVIELLAGWLQGRRPSPTPDEEEPSTQDQKGRPRWFASLRGYARPGVSHDMDSIRSSIERGLGRERRTSRDKR